MSKGERTAEARDQSTEYEPKVSRYGKRLRFPINSAKNEANFTAQVFCKFSDNFYYAFLKHFLLFSAKARKMLKNGKLIAKIDVASLVFDTLRLGNGV